jgi:hypothetical protein
MRPRPPLAALALAGLPFALLFAACSDDTANTSTSPPVTICQPSVTDQPAADLPNVAAITTAIDALETKLGGAQQYFEINATARIVNLFVALNDGKVAQPWVWVDGELTSKEGQAASGGTFVAADLDYDPAAVLSQVRAKVPEAILESFYVNGNGQGGTLYGVLASAQCGGGLDVVVGPDGAVKSVDPVS